jgi:mannitol-specific phosphotransferase system IIBC component
MCAEEYVIPWLKPEEVIALSHLKNCLARKRRCSRIAMNVALIAGVCGIILSALLISQLSHGGKEVATKAVGTDLLRQVIKTAFVSLAALFASFSIPAVFTWLVAALLLSSRRSKIQKEIEACATEPATKTGMVSIKAILNTHDVIRRRMGRFDQLVVDGPDGMYLGAEACAFVSTIDGQP